MLELLLISTITGATTIIGCLIALSLKNKKIASSLGIGLSAGIMISISLMELIPASFKILPEYLVIISFSLGFLLLMIIDMFLPHLHFTKESDITNKILKMGYMVAIGLIIHDFPEGFTLANAYLLNKEMGILIALSIAIHNIPEGFVISLPFILANKKKVLPKVILASVIAQPLGTLVGLFFISTILNIIPFSMAFTAGSMIFISIDEFIPLVKNFKERYYFAFGLFLGILTYSILSIAF